MRDLSAKLAMLGTQAPKAQAKPPPTDCLERETRYPLEPGMRQMLDATLEQVAAIDPRLPLEDFDPERVLFLDTETTGLSGGVGTVPFLVGLGWISGGDFVLRQLLMRDYAEEPFVLHRLLELWPRFDLIVTYNGKTFDLPLLVSRFVLHRLPRDTFPEAHLDLLHPARAAYKLRLSRCTLTNLEGALLDLHREDDLPGSQVPERYFEYLKTREMALLDDVMRHNDQDIRSLCLLMGKLMQTYTQPEQLGFAADVLSVGRVLERRGDRLAARRCFRVAASGQTAPWARVLLAGSLRRDAEYEKAQQVYLEMLTHGEGGVLPYVELAKLLEHRQKDPVRALAYTKAALRLVDPEREPELQKELEHRRGRLAHKAAKNR